MIVNRDGNYNETSFNKQFQEFCNTPFTQFMKKNNSKIISKIKTIKEL